MTDHGSNNTMLNTAILDLLDWLAQNPWLNYRIIESPDASMETTPMLSPPTSSSDGGREQYEWYRRQMRTPFKEIPSPQHESCSDPSVLANGNVFHGVFCSRPEDTNYWCYSPSSEENANSQLVGDSPEETSIVTAFMPGTDNYLEIPPKSQRKCHDWHVDSEPCKSLTSLCGYHDFEQFHAAHLDSYDPDACHVSYPPIQDNDIGTPDRQIASTSQLMYQAAEEGTRVLEAHMLFLEQYPPTLARDGPPQYRPSHKRPAYFSDDTDVPHISIRRSARPSVEAILQMGFPATSSEPCIGGHGEKDVFRYYVPGQNSSGKPRKQRAVVRDVAHPYLSPRPRRHKAACGEFTLYGSDRTAYNPYADGAASRYTPSYNVMETTQAPAESTQVFEDIDESDLAQQSFFRFLLDSALEINSFPD
ncbi:hypothetical protein CERSUDRAFT_92849 [Gelatoporia subvermispora B]|uniref:Uncharacterized protein n=1 Tax=Ceriporiopsis subvermispora (strain B) TaxID=914234 RepID=M2RK22_CERS8|nr:hypothetical protein CERSUDRAFT_92849 [Gelatoporia subvermispora B]